MTLLYLIRHGETAYNAEKRIQGQSDPPLSELGCRQAEAVAAALADEPIEAVYCSPLSRAAETARRIVNGRPLPLYVDDRLMELNAGVFEGRLRSEIMETHPEELIRWLAGDEDFVMPGGESRRQLAERGCAALRDIIAAGHQVVAVVSHGGLISATLRALLHMHEPLPPFSLRNGSITRLAADEQGHFTLVTLNEIEHLRGLLPAVQDSRLL